MAQPYAGYGGYPAAQPGWGGYPGPYAGYPPSAAYPTGYDYNSYYQQQGYDYSAYYSQQQASGQPAAASSAGTAVVSPQPPPEEPPPLPEEAPPPLPPGDEPAANGEQKAAVEPAAVADSTAQQSSDVKAYASYYPGQQQYGSSAYGAYYQGGYAQPSYPSYDYTQYPSLSTNAYASQVAPSSAQPPVPSSATQDYSRMPPPASLSKGSSAPAAASGSNATPIGGGTAAANSAANSNILAMRAAAEAVAKRLSATRGQAQPQYVSVGTAAPPATTAPAAVSSANDQAKELPSSLQQYVARALAVMGRSTETRLELRTVLRDLIAKHKKEGTLWSTDWDREPLPVLSKQSRFTDSLIPSGRQPDHDSRGWDTTGKSATQQQRHDDSDSPRSGTPRSNRKRSRYNAYQVYGDSDSSGDEGDGGGHSSWHRKPKVDLVSKKGKWQQSQQQHTGKKGRKGKKHNQWFADEQQQQQEWTAEEQAKHAARNARFGVGSNAGRSSTMAAYGWDEGSMAVDDGEFIVGTCQKLEKRYLRLTRAPLPEEVRPQPVLEAALQRLLGMIESKGEKYLYYNDQFKAMRQDLTVQGIKNQFTVQVYEAHARAALEYGDGAEYNQCQTQLAILYAAGLPGSHAEFGAYRLLYQSVHAAAGEGRRLLGTMKQMLGNKVGQVADSPEVQHAMQVRGALASSNVSRFFQLYLRAPRLGRCLMDLAVKQLRWKALNTLVRAHKPGTIALPFLASTLGFSVPESQTGAIAGDSQSPSAAQQQGPKRASPTQQLRVQLAALTIDEQGKLLPGCSEGSCTGENGPAVDSEQGLLACLEWCKKHGAVFDSEADLASCTLLTKDCWNRLFIPQDTTKVAHGDVNLDIRDFLAL
eukprot:GHUV01002116.1.p1 GENE.GHUV01002116.1~~GHUV01002116.1.p1  ORF type:complete len:870 (+),score=280.77 GHUV01002116.1:553-3162(+)